MLFPFWKKRDGIGAVALVLASLAPLLALSVFASGAAARRNDVTTVTLVAAGRETAALNAAIARFEQQYPNIVIKASYPPGAALIATEVNALTTGTGPDLMSLGVGGAPSANIPSVWAVGPRSLVDLSGRPWAKQLWRPLLPLESVAGKVYAAPLTNALLTVVYNKDLFAQLGLNPPTTWAGLLAECNQIANQERCRSSWQRATPSARDFSARPFQRTPSTRPLRTGVSSGPRARSASWVPPAGIRRCSRPWICKVRAASSPRRRRSRRPPPMGYSTPVRPR